ncbi:MAG TPA: TPM domain-containing protein, partial [Corynebacterium amycolatum]|nr:TPM domain-containing protein [Corynebacterium amycolatum]
MSDRNRVFRPLYLAASGAFLGLSMPLITAALPTQPPVHAPLSLLALAPSASLAHAEAPADVSGDVDDLAGVLSSGEEARLKEQIQQLKTDKRLLFSVFYIKSFDGVQGEQWAQQAWEHLGAADNRGVLVVAVEDRNLGAFVGNSFPSNAE